jgi:glutathione S-transferase
MKLYGHPMSTCTRKVLTTLAEKGHEAEFVLVDLMKGETKQPANLARQPFGQVPTLEDDGFVLYESRAIIRYLDEKLSGPKLTPSEIREHARMEQWISVETSDFTPPAMTIILNNLFGRMQGKTPDADAVSKAREKVGATLDVLDAALATKDFLAGGQFSLADICYMPYIEYLFAAESGDLVTKRAHAGAWWKRISERPSWKKATGK